jgi:hypothetical protein
MGWLMAPIPRYLPANEIQALASRNKVFSTGKGETLYQGGMGCLAPLLLAEAAAHSNFMLDVNNCPGCCAIAPAKLA